MLDEAISRRRYFEQKLDCSKFSVLSGPLHLISCTPKYLGKNQSAIWSMTTRKSLLDQKFMLSRPLHEGHYFLKAVMGNPHTKQIHLDKLANLLNESVVGD